jgi:parallel beta-helix repeat protein
MNASDGTSTNLGNNTNWNFTPPDTGVRYWISSGAGNWNTAANWSTASGGIAAGGVPVATHTVVFDGGGSFNGNANIDTTVSISSLTISGYSGIINTQGFGVTMSGHFTQGSGTVQLGTSNVNLGGNFTYTAGNFDAGTSSVTFYGGTSTVLSAGTTGFYQLALNKTGGSSVTISGYLYTASTANINGGTLAFSRLTNSTWTMSGGDLRINSGGVLDMGTAGSPISSSVKARLELSSGSSAGQYGLLANAGSKFYVFGAVKMISTTTVNSLPEGVANRITLPSDPVAQGWAVGDTITISPAGGGTTGPSSTIERTITSFPGSNQVLLDSNITTNHYSSWTITVANLTRNVLIRSVGTNTATNTAYLQNNITAAAADFNVNWGEFAYLGANVANKVGIEFNGGSVLGSISSSTVRSGYLGIYLDQTDNVSLQGNIIYKNNAEGIRLYSGSSNNTLTSNQVYANSSVGIYFQAGCPNNMLTSNQTYSNSNVGIYFENSGSYNTLTSNQIYSNSNVGIYFLGGSNYNTLIANQIYSNSDLGIYSENSAYNTLINNRIFSNLNDGIHFEGSHDTTLISLDSRSKHQR